MRSIRLVGLSHLSPCSSFLLPASAWCLAYSSPWSNGTLLTSSYNFALEGTFLAEFIRAGNTAPDTIAGLGATLRVAEAMVRRGIGLNYTVITRGYGAEPCVARHHK